MPRLRLAMTAGVDTRNLIGDGYITPCLKKTFVYNLQPCFQTLVNYA